MGLKLKLGSVIVGLYAATACSHVPVEGYPADADPSVEISKVEAQRNDLLAQHADVLSPKHFKKATDDFSNATKLRTENKSNDKILKELAESRGELAQVADYTKLGQETLAGVIQARADAIKANAPDLDSGAFRDAEKKLMKVAADIEDNDKAPAMKQRGEIEAAYRGAEYTALKRAYTGTAMNTQQQAVKEGAEEYARSTLGAFNDKADAANSFINTHRQDLAGLDNLRTSLTADATHLLKVTRESKATGSKNGEAIVLKREAEEQRVAAAEKALNDTRTELQATEAALAATRSQASGLEAQKALQDRIKGVKSTFNSREAEVFQQGNNILIRLKGLDFASGSANIKTHDYVLLNKVRDVITSFSPSMVTITGHTDGKGKASINKKLSAERAAAVKTYLQANMTEPGAATFSDTIGMGDEQPLASNKTAAGRATNRRVDVMIAPSSVAH